MRAVPGTIIAVSLLAVLEWGHCAGCFALTASHDCCKRTEQPPCHGAPPAGPRDCPDCAASASALLAAAKPEVAAAVTAPLTADGLAAVAVAPLTLPAAEGFARQVAREARAGPPGLYLVNRVLLI